MLSAGSPKAQLMLVFGGVNHFLCDYEGKKELFSVGKTLNLKSISEGSD